MKKQGRIAATTPDSKAVPSGRRSGAKEARENDTVRAQVSAPERAPQKSSAARPLPRNAAHDPELRVRSAMDHMLEGCQLLDHDWRYLYINAAAEAQNRRPSSELLGRRYVEMWPGIEATEVFALIGRVLRDRVASQMENEFAFPDGTLGWFDLRIEPVPEGVLILSVDITTRKHAEIALRRTHEQLHEAQRAAHVGTWEWDTVNNAIVGSDEFVRLFDCTPAEIASLKLWSARIHPDERERVEQELADAVERGRPYDTDYRVRLRDGGWRTLSARGALFTDERGKPTRMVGTCIDVTERRKNEARLGASEARSRATLESIGEGVISIDAAGKVEMMNSMAEKLTGWTQDEARDRPHGEVLRVVREDTRAHAESPVSQVLRAGEVVGFASLILVARDGREHPVAFSGAPIREVGGRIAGVVLVIRDESRDRLIQETLRRSEERFRLVFENASLGRSITYPNGDVHPNRAFGEMLGYTAEEITGVRWDDLTHPDDVAATRRQLDAMLAGTLSSARFEKRYIHRNGRTVWTEVNTTLQRDPQGLPAFFISSVEDIGERRRTLTALQESERKYRSLFERMLNGFAYCKMLYDGDVAADFTYLDVNDAFSSLTGLKDVVGRRVSEVIPGIRESDPELFAIYGRVARTGVPETVEILVEALSMWFSISVYCPQPEHFVAVFDVITERKRVESELRTLNAELEQRVHDRTEQLEASNHELEAFSYSVSHDLRAPLRAIDGFTRILVDEVGPRLGDEEQRICGIIRENTGRMGRLIDDLLAFSRLSRAELQPSRIEMRVMADSVFRELLVTPEELARIDFRVGELPAAVGDPSLMRQVWSNLLSNAIKFSSKREGAVIEVTAAQVDGETVYSVRDNGAGFDMRYADKLFGVFQRLHSTKEFEGTGVGLALVQRIVRRHGGRVWAHGEVGSGATFSFALQQPEA